MEQQLLELTLARLERAEKLLERAAKILPRVEEPIWDIDHAVFRQLARDVATFLEEGK